MKNEKSAPLPIKKIDLVLKRLAKLKDEEKTKPASDERVGSVMKSIPREQEIRKKQHPSETELGELSEIEERKSSVGLSSRTGARVLEPKKYTRQDLIKEGLFVEKDGDLIPTEKYNKLKASGEIKKYNII